MRKLASIKLFYGVVSGESVMQSEEQIKRRLAEKESKLVDVAKTEGHRRKDWFAKEYLPLKGEVEALRWVLGI